MWHTPPRDDIMIMLFTFVVNVKGGVGGLGDDTALTNLLASVPSSSAEAWKGGDCHGYAYAMVNTTRQLDMDGAVCKNRSDLLSLICLLTLVEFGQWFYLPEERLTHHESRCVM